MAQTRRPRGRPAATPTDAPGTLFIRDVPGALLTDLDAWREELRESSPLYAGVSRQSLALDIIAKGVEAWKRERDAKRAQEGGDLAVGVQDARARTPTSK